MLQVHGKALMELSIVDMNIAKEKKHGKTRSFIVLKG